MPETADLFASALDHHRQGRTAEAAWLYQAVLAQAPHHTESLRLLGVIAGEAGDVDQAITLLRHALEHAPDHPASLLNLGAALRQRGRESEAEACFRRALAVRPAQVEARLALAALLQAQEGREAEAAACYRAALALQPDRAEAHLNFGVFLLGAGLFHEAAAHCQRAVTLKPHWAVAHNGLGAAQLGLRQLEAAQASLIQALRLNPDFPEAHNNLGTVAQALGRPQEAAGHYRAALALRPKYALAHENLGMTLLSLGKYAEGFCHYEWRKLAASVPFCPSWDGGDPAGQTLLLVAEQGLGDTLQFIRYARLLRQRGARVVVACQPELVRLLGLVPEIDQVAALGDPWPTADCWAALLSVPALVGTTLETVPADIPYLTAAPQEVAAWTVRLAGCEGLKVGLVWAGNSYPQLPKGQAMDRRRSLALVQFAPLATVPGVTLISLQKGPAAVEAQSLPPEFPWPLFDPMADVADFADTAALVAAMDLVIGVDTAVIHLAGALAKPVWVLSRFDACWRWLADRNTSPWYPTLRLFRQAAPGDWGPVVEEVRACLHGFHTLEP
jgi:tetratricopeptide (TPR) repeat protein